MTRKNVHDFARLAATSVVTKASWALILIVLLRHLGARDFGVLATLWAAAVMAAGVVDLGSAQALLREGAREPALARALAARALAIQIVLALALVAALAVGFDFGLPAPWLDPTARPWIIGLGVAAPLLDRLQALFTVWSQLGGNYRAYSWLRAANFVVLLLVIATIAWRGGGLLAVALAYALVTLAFVLLTGLGTWRVLPPAAATAKVPSLAVLVRLGLPFLAITCLTLAYGRVEVTLLGLAGLSAVAGSFHVLYQLVLLVFSVSGLFFTVTYPRLYAHRGDAAALAADYRDSVRWMAVLGWCAALPMALFAAPVLDLVGGAELARYAAVLKLLALIVLLLPATVALNFLLPADRLRARIGCDALGIAVTVAIAAWAATRGSVLGVAVGAVVGYALAAVLALAALRTSVPGWASSLGRAYVAIGVRVIPAAILAWWVPLAWVWRALLFAVVAAALLLSEREIGGRVRGWLAGVEPDRR